MRIELLEQLVEDRGQGRAVVLATNLDTGEQTLHYPLDADPDDGNSIREEARRALLSDRSRPVHGPDGRYFLLVHNPPRRIVVVGAVHIAQSLARMATQAGFSVTVVDPRRAFNTSVRFPGVDRIAEWPAPALAKLSLNHRTAVVTLTHDPKLDDPALVAALGSPAFYVGALGSRRTHGRRLERLTERGLGREAVSRIRAPVGLDIGAQTPAEIAVAILAEVIGEQRRDVK